MSSRSTSPYPSVLDGICCRNDHEIWVFNEIVVVVLRIFGVELKLK